MGEYETASLAIQEATLALQREGLIAAHVQAGAPAPGGTGAMWSHRLGHQEDGCEQSAQRTLRGASRSAA